MAKVVIIRDNGTQELVREVANDYYKGNILFRDDYFATKLWSREDIEDRMESRGYTVTPERVDAVIKNGGKWWGLSDCNDGEWDCIDDEIYVTLGEPDNLDDEEEDEDGQN